MISTFYPATFRYYHVTHTFLLQNVYGFEYFQHSFSILGYVPINLAFSCSSRSRANGVFGRIIITVLERIFIFVGRCIYEV